MFQSDYCVFTEFDFLISLPLIINLQNKFYEQNIKFQKAHIHLMTFQICFNLFVSIKIGSHQLIFAQFNHTNSEIKKISQCPIKMEIIKGKS